MTRLIDWKVVTLTNYPSVAIQCSAVFGSPARSCAGSGLCKLLPRTDNRARQACCPLWPVTLNRFSEENFDLVLPSAVVKNSAFFHGLKKNGFYMESPFVFPPWLCESLGITAAYVPAGWYPVFSKRGKLKLSLRLVEGYLHRDS